MPRSLVTIIAALALLLPLAFTSLFESAENRVRDAKAQALEAGDLGGWDAHELVDTAKQERVAAAQASAEAMGAIPFPAAAPCTAGFAGPYPCQNVDLASVVPLAELGGVAGNDSWGWTDDNDTPDDATDDREIALAGTGTGVAFVDITEPTSPVVLGRVQSRGGIDGSGIDSGVVWRDVKVAGNWAFIVAEVASHGMQVFDLTRLRDHYGSADPTRVFEPDHVDESFSSAHNIVVNPDSDTAFVVGTRGCDDNDGSNDGPGGLHMIDISDPLDTTVAGCYGADGYVHDAQCTFYRGVDPDYNGENAEDGEPSELCFANIEERGVAIVDVTDKANPVRVASIDYTSARYSHQGWLTPDHRFFVFNDELDEQNGSVDNTTTYILPLDELDHGVKPAPVGDQLIKAYSHESLSTDHNLYITDTNEALGATRPLIWQANYNQGLQVFAYTDEGLREGDMTRVGYFRVDSMADAPHYGDSWNVYPYFESGTVILSNLGQGLVVLQPNYAGMVEAAGS